jgi:hypothetical protein
MPCTHVQRGGEFRSIPRNDARRSPKGSARRDAAATTAVPRGRCSKIVEWQQANAAQLDKDSRFEPALSWQVPQQHILRMRCRTGAAGATTARLAQRRDKTQSRGEKLWRTRAGLSGEDVTGGFAWPVSVSATCRQRGVEPALLYVCWLYRCVLCHISSLPRLSRLCVQRLAMLEARLPLAFACQFSTCSRTM